VIIVDSVVFLIVWIGMEKESVC